MIDIDPRERATAPDRPDPWERGLVLVVLVMFAALVAMPVYNIFLHVPRNNNEGWNAYQAVAAMSGGVLYPPWDAMTSNNYPPLSFYLVGAAGRLFGDYIIAGRLIALAALLVTAVNVFRLSRWIGADRVLALFGMAWFLLAIYSLRPGYIAMDDPQFLALALVTSGAMAFLSGAEPKLFLDMLLAALLIVAGGLTKQNVIALPLALCTWAAIHDRRRLRLFLTAALMVAGPALALLYGAWGKSLLDSVLFSPRLALWQKSIAMTRQILPVIIVFLVSAILGGIFLRPRSKGTFVCLFLFWSGATGFWMLSGAGINYNVIFDLMIALAVGCVAAVVAIAQTTLPLNWPAGRKLLMSVLATTQIACTLYYYRNPNLHEMDALFHASDWASLTNQVAQANGPVACELLAVCYWADKPFEVDFFNYGQKLLTGAVSDAAFRERLGQKYYAYVLIHKSSLTNPILPADTMQWLLANYKPVRLVDGDALLLKPPP